MVKLVVEAPDRRVIELKHKNEALRAALASLEVTKQRMEERVVGLEASLAAAAGREAAVRENRDRDVKRATEALWEQTAKCQEVQLELQQERNRRMAAEAELQLVKGKLEGEALTAKNGMAAAERDLSRVQEAAEEEEEQWEAKERALQAEMRLLRGQLAAVMEENEQLSQAMDEMEENAEEARANQLALEQQLAEADSEAAERSSERRRGHEEEREVLVKHLQEEMARMAADVGEARLLKRKRCEAEDWKHEAEAARERAAQMETKCCRLVETVVQLEEVQAELSRWKEAAKKIPGVKSSDDLVVEISLLQREVIAAASRVGDAAAELAAAEASRRLEETRRREAEKEAERMKGELKEKEKKILTMERELSASLRDLSSMRRLLESYDEEERELIERQKATLQLSPGCTAKDASGRSSSELGLTPEKAKRQRIEELEASLAAERAAAGRREEALKLAIVMSEQHDALVAGLRREVEAAGRRAGEMETMVDALRKEVMALEEKVARGEFNSAKFKVLHMRWNPMDWDTSKDVDGNGGGDFAEQDMLHGAISQLQEGRGVKEGGSGLGGTISEQQASPLGVASETPLASSSKVNGELLAQLEVARKRLKAMEKKETRLKEIFQEKIQNFREACFHLFGYRVSMREEDIDGTKTTTFALRSMFSMGPDEVLQFQSKGPGQFELLASSFTSSDDIRLQVSTFLKRFRCIPAFTANMTMELFNKTTMS